MSPNLSSADVTLHLGNQKESQYYIIIHLDE